MFLSSFSQAVLHRENLKILTLSECNDFPNHPRNQKKNQNLFGWEHKAICRNQDATCLPSELHNLCKRNNCMSLIVDYNWVQRMRMLLKLGTRKRRTGPGNGKNREKLFTLPVSKEKKTKKASQRANSWSHSRRKVNERVKNSLSLEG